MITYYLYINRKKKSFIFYIFKLATERIDNGIRDTNTLQTDNYKKWNWDLILALLTVKFYLKKKNEILGFC